MCFWTITITYFLAERGKGKHELHIHSIKAHRTSRLTRRDEGVLDCIALDEVALYAVHTLNDVSIKSLHIAHSTDCHSVLCITLDRVHYTREGRVYELSFLRCPIVYPTWVRENINVSTDESELVQTVFSMELQGDIEGSCERKYTHSSFQRLSLQLWWLYTRYIQCIGAGAAVYITKHTINWLVGPYLHCRE